MNLDTEKLRRSPPSLKKNPQFLFQLHKILHKYSSNPKLQSKLLRKKEKIILMAELCNTCSRVVVFKSLLLLQFSRYSSQIFTQSNPNCWEERQGFTFWHFSILWFLIDFQKSSLYRVPKTPVFLHKKIF